MVARKLLPVAAVLLLVPFAAHAASVIDDIVGGYQSAMQGWEGPLQQAALRTFGLLALIQAVLSLIPVVMRKPDMSDIMAWMIREVLTIGAWMYIIDNYAYLDRIILDSFQFAAGLASGGHAMTPGDMFNAGVDLVAQAGHPLSLLHFGSSVLLAFLAAAIFFAFVAITATMALALIEAYFFASAGVLFIAFGGWAFSRDIAINIIRVVLGIGARLFALQLVANIGTGLMHGAIADYMAGDIDIHKAAVVAGEAIILFVVSWALPNKLERAVAGPVAGFAGAREVFSAAAGVATGTIAAAGATAGTALGAVGAGKVVGASVSAARSSMAAQAQMGMGPQTAAGRAATMMGRTVGNIAGGIGRELGGRVTGQILPRGHVAFRIAGDIAKRSQGTKP